MTIWVFGDSLSTNYGVSLEQSWPEIIAKKLNTKVNNHAHEAVDNFFIFSNYLNQQDKIKSNDIIIVQWTSPNRKMFVLDKENTNHKKVLKNDNISVTRNNITYFRSGAAKVNGWFPNIKRNDTLDFFNIWYENYFSMTESEINLKAYKLASCKKNVVHLQFNEILDFITKNKLYLSKDDLHPNVQGHKQLASNIMEKINGVL